MITGDIKNKIDQIWDTFFVAGITNPITVLEQMTYIFFMKLLDDKQIHEEENARDWETELKNPTFPEGQMWMNPESGQEIPYEELRWSVFKNTGPENMFNMVRQNVFEFIKHIGTGEESAYSRYMKSAIFLIPNARTLTKVVDGVDSLSTDNDDERCYSLIMANPPFAGSLDKGNVNKKILAYANTTKTEILFLAQFVRSLALGGRCASIVPDGVLFGTSKAHLAIRKEIVDNQKMIAVISMPSGVFKPYAGVSTAVLIFTKTNSPDTDKVWFYDMRADGFSLDDKRSPVADNDIPDVVNRFLHLDAEESRSRKEQSFFVPVEEIRENDYDLSINKYKEVEREKVVYDSVSTILARLHKSETEYVKGYNKLVQMLGEE